jgi:predicted  nucleic acid-binding Zn-ribbon protein
MALNLSQALGILVQSAQAHLNGELLTSESDRNLLTESINMLMETEKELEKEKELETEKIKQDSNE